MARRWWMKGELEPDPPPAPPPVKPDTWGVLDVKLAEPLLVGDRVDFKTMEVVKRRRRSRQSTSSRRRVAIGPVKL
jgi:hypothetical protein